MPAGHGLRARTRDSFSRGFRQKGYIPLSVYLRTYKLGDYVDIKVNSAVQKVRILGLYWRPLSVLARCRLSLDKLWHGHKGSCTVGIACCSQHAVCTSTVPVTFSGGPVGFQKVCRMGTIHLVSIQGNNGGVLLVRALTCHLSGCEALFVRTPTYACLSLIVMPISPSRVWLTR